MPRICLRNSRLWFLPLIILSLLLGFAAPAVAQYRKGWHGATEPMNRQEQKNTQQKEAYEKYKLKKEQMNQEREKNGLAPSPIVTFEQWKQGMR
jgi:cytochrome c-type biogenesis protein CcmH/NrfF